MTSANKRVAQNTLMLYIRMFFIMSINIYISRVVLDTLGEIDYGIYNVVGGIVAMFTLLKSTLSTATQRFLNVSLGKNLLAETKKTFSMSVIIHVLLALIILLASETLGLWFLNHKMNISADRMYAAQWTFQFSLFTSIISFIQIPYHASIIANEKMKIYTYVSIFEAILKLTILYLLIISSIDKLITYAVLLFVVQFIVLITYIISCKYNFPESRFKLIWDKELFKKMLSYSSWNTMSGLAGVFSKEGINILLNIFFGPAVNAARGIALQINNAVSGFANNFQIAVNPQIVKLYASEKRKEMFNLIINNAKYAFFLMSLMSIPFILEIDFVLQLWLKEVPEYTGLFSQIILSRLLFSSIHAPLAIGIHAHGKMSIPNLTTSSVHLLVLPISYGLLKLGFPVYTPFIVMFFDEFITIFIDLVLLKKFIDFPISKYLIIIVKFIIIVFVAITIPVFIHFNLELGWTRFIVVLITSVSCLTFVVYKWGITDSIKQMLKEKIKAILKLK